MKIVWDEPERVTNLAKHGLDFADLDPDFFAAAMVSPAKKRDRFVAIGEYGAGIIVTWCSGPWCGGSLGDFHATGEPQRKEQVMPRKFSSKRPLTDAEEAEIQRMIASDPDNPELTDEQIAGLRPFAEAFPALVESLKRVLAVPSSTKRLSL